MRNPIHPATFIIILTISSGCSKDVCDPGATQECFCAPGVEGIQSCRQSGSGWQPCDCGSVDSSTDNDVSDDTAMDGGCIDDSDCDNGIFCDGEELCLEGTCVSADPVQCDDSDSCTSDACDEDAGECTYGSRDEDGDGFIDALCGGDDCDDSRDDTYPGSMDLGCHDSVDQDCDGVTDGDTLLATTQQIGAGIPRVGRLHSSTWSGSEFAVVWHEQVDVGIDVFFARVGDDGVLVGSAVLVGAGDPPAEYPDIAWSGSVYGVAWVDQRDGGASEIYFSVLDPVGTPLCSDLRVTEAPAPSTHPSIVWTGSEFSVAWQDTRDGNWALYSGRVGDDGTSTAVGIPVTDALTHAAENPDTVWTGSEVVMAWVDNRDGNDEIYFGRVAADGAIIDSGTRLTDTVGETRHVSLSWTGSDLGVSWQDYRGAEWGIYFVKLASDGGRLSSDLLISPLDDPMGGEDFGLAAVVWTGSDFAMCFHQNVTDPELSAALFSSRVAADGGSFVPPIQLTQIGSFERYFTNCTLSWSGTTLGVGWEFYPDLATLELQFNLVDGCR